VNARRRVEYTRGLLESIGLEGQRLQMINVSAAMAGEFAFSAAEIAAEIHRLGPSPLKMDDTRPPVEIADPIEE
jgi:F420-non-reducing hydrogenase iron-sulfur subunit